jgi:hypothetical protein
MSDTDSNARRLRVSKIELSLPAAPDSLIMHAHSLLEGNCLQGIANEMAIILCQMAIEVAMERAYRKFETFKQLPAAEHLGLNIQKAVKAYVSLTTDKAIEQEPAFLIFRNKFQKIRNAIVHSMRVPAQLSDATVSVTVSDAEECIQATTELIRHIRIATKSVLGED